MCIFCLFIITLLWGGATFSHTFSMRPMSQNSLNPLYQATQLDNAAGKCFQVSGPTLRSPAARSPWRLVCPVVMLAPSWGTTLPAIRGLSPAQGLACGRRSRRSSHTSHPTGRWGRGRGQAYFSAVFNMRKVIERREIDEDHRPLSPHLNLQLPFVRRAHLSSS